MTRPQRPNPDFLTGTRVSEGSRVGVVAETTPGTRAAGMIDVVFEGGYGGPERRRASALKRVNPIPELVKGKNTPYKEMGLYKVPFDRRWEFRQKIAGKNEKRGWSGGADVRTWYAVGSGKCWVGCISFRTEYGDDRYIDVGLTLQSGPSWGVAENKVERWFFGPDTKDALSETGAGGLTFLKWAADQLKEKIASEKDLIDMGGHSSTVAVSWADDQRRRVYAWLERLGFHYGHDADGDPAYILRLGDSHVTSHTRTHANPHAGDERRADAIQVQWAKAADDYEHILDFEHTFAGILTPLEKQRIKRVKEAYRVANEALFSKQKRNPRTPEGWEVYDPKREQFNATVQGVYESLATRDLRKPFYDARRNRADVKALASGAWSTDDVRRILSQAFAIATSQGQKHGFLKPGTNAPTGKGVARSEARYAAAEAAHRVENRTDYETTLRLARKDQKSRIVVEGGKITFPRAPVQLLTGNARRNPHVNEKGSGWYKYGNIIARPRAYSGTWMIQKLSDGRYKLFCDDEGEENMVREQFGTFNTLKEAHAVIQADDKDAAEGRMINMALRKPYFAQHRAWKTEHKALRKTRSNPIESKTKQIGIVGVGNYLGGIRTGTAAENTPTTLYAVGPALDPDKVGYFVLTCSPFKKDVQNALRDIGGWTLLPNVTSTAYLNTLGVTVKRGGVVEQSAPAVHKVYKEATLKGARYTVVDARDISRGEFSNKADAFEFAKIRDRKVAQLGVPQVHGVANTTHGWEVYGLRGETSEMESLKFDNAKRNEERTLLLDKLWKDVKAAEKAGQIQLAERLRHDRENLYLQPEWETDLFYDTEEKARRVAEKLDFRAASKGALPIKGFRTKAGIGGQKAEDIFNKTIAIFDQKRVHYVLDRSIVPAEKLTEAKLKLRSADRLRAQATHLGESPKKLAAIEDEAYLRGRKTLINKILKIVDRQAEQKLLDYASSVWGTEKLAAVLAEPRSTTKMRATLPGGFNVPARAFGEDRKTGFSKEATTWEHLAGRLWPKGGIPQQFFPVFSYKVLSEWSDDTLRALAKKCGYSDAQVKKFETGAETSALAKVLATHDARSTIDQIRMGKIEHDIPLAQRVEMERQRAGTARVAGGAVKPMRPPRDTSRPSLPPVDKKTAEILKQARQSVVPSYVGLSQLPKPVPVEETVLARASAASESAEDRRARVAQELAALEAEVERQRKLLPKVSASVGSHAPSWGTVDPSETPLARDLRESARALAEADTKPKRRSKKTNPRHRRIA